MKKEYEKLKKYQRLKEKLGEDVENKGKSSPVIIRSRGTVVLV